MGLVVALDTSTPTIGVAVGDGAMLAARAVQAGRETGSRLPDAVAQTLAEAGASVRDIEVVAVGVGPGPYTSLRVGIMFARAVAAALDVPIVGACSLDIVARGLAPADVIVMADARRREVYWARYTDGRRVLGPWVGGAEKVMAEHPGVAVVRDVGVDAGLLVEWVVSAWPLGTVPGVSGPWAAAGTDGSSAQPVPQGLLAAAPLYLRRPDAVEPVIS